MQINRELAAIGLIAALYGGRWWCDDGDNDEQLRALLTA